MLLSVNKAHLTTLTVPGRPLQARPRCLLRLSVAKKWDEAIQKVFTSHAVPDHILSSWLHTEFQM